MTLPRSPALGVALSIPPCQAESTASKDEASRRHLPRARRARQRRNYWSRRSAGPGLPLAATTPPLRRCGKRRRFAKPLRRVKQPQQHVVRHASVNAPTSECNASPPTNFINASSSTIVNIAVTHPPQLPSPTGEEMKASPIPSRTQIDEPQQGECDAPLQIHSLPAALLAALMTLPHPEALEAGYPSSNTLPEPAAGPDNGRRSPPLEATPPDVPAPQPLTLYDAAAASPAVLKIHENPLAPDSLRKVQPAVRPPRDGAGQKMKQTLLTAFTQTPAGATRADLATTTAPANDPLPEVTQQPLTVTASTPKLHEGISRKTARKESPAAKTKPAASRVRKSAPRLKAKSCTKTPVLARKQTLLTQFPNIQLDQTSVPPAPGPPTESPRPAPGPIPNRKRKREREEEEEERDASERKRSKGRKKE